MRPMCVCLCAPDTPSQRVQFLLGMEDDDEEHIPHDLFTELDEICLREGEEAEWRETARSDAMLDLSLKANQGSSCHALFSVATLPDSSLTNTGSGYRGLEMLFPLCMSEQHLLIFLMFTENREPTM